MMNRITAIFATTTTDSTRAESLVPVMTSRVSTSSMPKATQFVPVSTCECSTSQAGVLTSKPSRVATRYVAHTRATRAAATSSSRISAQPTSQAQISPMAT